MPRTATNNSGWLRIEDRKNGRTWVIRFYTTRAADGMRVENTKAVGLVADLPTKSSAWAAVERLHLNLNDISQKSGSMITFAEIASSYVKYKLSASTGKSPTTIGAALRVINRRLLPRFGDVPALSIKPLNIMEWFAELREEEDLEGETMRKIKQTMKLIYDHAEMIQLLPLDKHSNPARRVEVEGTSSYKAIIPTAEQVGLTLQTLPLTEQTLTILIAATGLRISEALGLKWSDIDFVNGKITVQRRWCDGHILNTNSLASAAAVPMQPLLAEFLKDWKDETSYGGPDDWGFPSERLHGKQPRTANMLVEDYLRPAALKAGVPIPEGHRFGFHNLRHGLSTLLIAAQTDPRTVKDLLRHSDIRTTLQLYTQSVDDNRRRAQETALAAFFPTGKFSGGQPTLARV